MKQFSSFDEYSIDELIIIVYSESQQWQEEAVEYAKVLLKNKGITDLEAKTRLTKIEKDREIAYEKEVEENKVESYSVFELIFMTIFWPRYIIWDWYLAKNGFILKRKQRLYCIGIGMIFYLFLFLFAVNSYDQDEKKRMLQINTMAKSDSIIESKTDWTGKYLFIDTSTDIKKEVKWTLSLEKVNSKHQGLLEIYNGKQMIKIKCIGLIKKGSLEIFPDTIYKLFDGVEISYYDNLFSFVKYKNDTLTIWQKLRPYNSKNNNEKMFIKQ